MQLAVSTSCDVAALNYCELLAQTEIWLYLIEANSIGSGP